jgi:hypothetical protein
MRVFIYLRRGLLSLRSLVRGPLSSTNPILLKIGFDIAAFYAAPFLDEIVATVRNCAAAISCHKLASLFDFPLAPDVLVLRNHKSAEPLDKESSHSSSLTAKDHQRNRPLVLCFTGGNA